MRAYICMILRTASYVELQNSARIDDIANPCGLSSVSPYSHRPKPIDTKATFSIADPLLRDSRSSGLAHSPIGNDLVSQPKAAAFAEHIVAARHIAWIIIMARHYGTRRRPAATWMCDIIPLNEKPEEAATGHGPLGDAFARRQDETCRRFALCRP